MVVVEHGERAHWVRNALAHGGRLRVHLRGRWRDATMRVVPDDPDAYLRRMNPVHAWFVRRHSTAPCLAEITRA